MARGMHAGIKIYKLDNHNNSVNNEMLAFIASLEISDVYHIHLTDINQPIVV